MKKVMYLTGAPASGKSSLCRELQRILPNLAVFEYGKHLANEISLRSAGMTQDQLRERSSAIITPSDIAHLDEKLLSFVENERLTHPVVIDSHAVTLESYGFRAVCFQESQIRSLALDMIVCLQLSAEETIQRIQAEPLGRPVPTREAAERHTNLQSTVAVHYGITAGAPIYFLNASLGVSALAQQLKERLLR